MVLVKKATANISVWGKFYQERAPVSMDFGDWDHNKMSNACARVFVNDFVDKFVKEMTSGHHTHPLVSVVTSVEHYGSHPCLLILHQLKVIHHEGNVFICGIGGRDEDADWFSFSASELCEANSSTTVFTFEDFKSFRDKHEKWLSKTTASRSGQGESPRIKEKQPVKPPKFPFSMKYMFIPSELLAGKPFVPDED